MTIKLPPLPEMVQIDRHIPTNYVIRGYTAEQMEAYAREAVRLNMAVNAQRELVQPNAKVSGAGTASAGLPGYAAGGKGERK